MVPLSTTQGLSKEDLLSLVAGRDIYIWGGGPAAVDVLVSLNACGMRPRAFLDNRIKSGQGILRGIPIKHPDHVLDSSLDRQKTFLVIASESFGKHAETIISENTHLQRGRDYVSYHSISRPAAVVDVSGMCNLKCLSCPRGNLGMLMPEGIMSYETYEKVLRKLRKDLPLLTKIELSLWSEPLLNPELSRIVELTEKSVPCAVSTNLLVECDLEEIIKSQPSEFHITVNSSGKGYERMMPGASWDLLLGNLHKLGSLIRRHRPKTKFALTLHAYKFDGRGEMQKLLSAAQGLNLPLKAGQTYLNPYDNLLSYSNKDDISEPSKFVLGNLPWDVDKALALARKDIDRPCLVQRLFPVVNWDLSVSLCHVYYFPVIAENYLGVEWAELLSARHRAEHCRLCQKHALHRLDLDVLARRYPNEITAVYGRGNATQCYINA